LSSPSLGLTLRLEKRPSRLRKGIAENVLDALEDDCLPKTEATAASKEGAQDPKQDLGLDPKWALAGRTQTLATSPLPSDVYMWC
jgi:hypothetical protein